MKSRSLLLVPLLSAAVCFAQATPRPSPPVPPTAPRPPMAPLPPMPPGPGMGMGMGFGPPGIPPEVAQKVGISADTQKKVRDLSFEANDTLINLEADLKRAQLDLQRTLAQPQVDEPAVMNKLEVVSRAELAVRKNRMGLMVRIRKAVGPEAWEKLQAEMPNPGAGMMMGGGGPGRREIRIIRTDEGGETVDVRGE